jgi:malonate-semialdehyde dehydrogenase (acetylating)/methylmalonate-semialdehyde dehydrogenase
MSSTTQPTLELKLVNHWINGKTYDGPTERWGDVFNPATGESNTRVCFATPEVVDLAVKHAAAAQVKWGAASLAQRTRVLFSYRQLLDKHKVEMAAMITREHGKVAADALGEVSRGLEVVEFACGLPQLLKGEFSENVSTDVDSYSIRQPLGVVAGITPFNFPAMVPMWMYPLAIACGNAFILKPSEKDPVRGQLLREAPGRGRTPRRRVPGRARRQGRGRRDPHASRHRRGELRRLHADRALHLRTGTKAGKRVQALGGAKNHMVVLPDADMDLAADSAVSAGFGSAGERCMAISALVTVGDAADADSEDPGTHGEAQGRGRKQAGRRHGPARHPEHHAQGQGLRRQGRGRRREARRRRPRPEGTGARSAATSSGPASSTRSRRP